MKQFLFITREDSSTIVLNIEHIVAIMPNGDNTRCEILLAAPDSAMLKFNCPVGPIAHEITEMVRENKYYAAFHVPR